jgi:hypothetical protein
MTMMMKKKTMMIPNNHNKPFTKTVYSSESLLKSAAKSSSDALAGGTVGKAFVCFFGGSIGGAPPTSYASGSASIVGNCRSSTGSFVTLFYTAYMRPSCVIERIASYLWHFRTRFNTTRLATQTKQSTPRVFVRNNVGAAAFAREFVDCHTNHPVHATEQAQKQQYDKEPRRPTEPHATSVG